MADLTGAPDDPFLAWYGAGMDPYAPPLPELDFGGGGMHPTTGMPGGPVPPPPPPQQLVIPESALAGNAAGAPVAAAPPTPAPIAAATATPPSAPEPSAPPLLDAMHPLTAPPPGGVDLGPPPPDLPALEDPNEHAGGLLGAIGDAASPLIKADAYEIPDDVQAGRALADMAPEQRAILDAKRDVAARQSFAAKQLELARGQKEEADRNWTAYQEGTKRAEAKMVDVEADSKRLAAKKLDTSYPGGKLAAVLMGVVGGLVQGRTGSAQNYGLQLVQQGIDDWVNKQKTDIENGRADVTARRGIVAEEFARHGDLFRAAEAARAAGYERQIGMLQAEAQNYDPHGSAARTIADSIVGLRQAQSASLANARKNAIDEQTKLADYELKLLDVAKKRQALSGAGASPAGFDEKQVLPAEGWARIYGVDPKEVAGMPAMSGKQFKEVVGGGYELTKKRNEAGELVREQTIGDVNGEPLVDKDGKPHVFPKTQVDKLSEMQAGTREMVNTLGELAQLRGRAGGANGVLGPGDVADYTQLANRLTQQFASANHLSLADEQSQNFTRNIQLGGDPSNYRVGDIEARIRKAQQAAENAYNDRLKGAKYTGKRITFPDPFANPEGKGPSAIDKIVTPPPRQSVPAAGYPGASGVPDLPPMGG